MKDGVKWPFIPYDEYILRINKAGELSRYLTHDLWIAK